MGCSNPVVGSVVMGCFVDIFYASKVLKSIMLQCNWWIYVLNICKANFIRNKNNILLDAAAGFELMNVCLVDS